MTRRAGRNSPASSVASAAKAGREEAGDSAACNSLFGESHGGGEGGARR